MNLMNITGKLSRERFQNGVDALTERLDRRFGNHEWRLLCVVIVMVLVFVSVFVLTHFMSKSDVAETTVTV